MAKCTGIIRDTLTNNILWCTKTERTVINRSRMITSIPAAIVTTLVHESLAKNMSRTIWLLSLVDLLLLGWQVVILMTAGRVIELVAQINTAQGKLGPMIMIGITIKIESEKRRQFLEMSGSVIVVGVTGIVLNALDHHRNRKILALKGTHDDGDVRSQPRGRNMIQAAPRGLVIDAASKSLTNYFLYERTMAVDDL